MRPSPRFATGLPPRRNPSAGSPARRRGRATFRNLVFVPGTSIVLLGGAATVGDLRGRGIYTSLVARRLADARAAGADAAVIQAVRGTSAPVCARLGFKEVVPLEFYAWVPPGVDMDLHA